MAADSPNSGTTVGTEEAPRSDIEEHQATFDAFMDITKWACLVVAVILIGMLIFLV